jgi:hypothetical protein
MRGAIGARSGGGRPVSRNGLIAALIYCGGAFAAGLAFWLVTTFAGSYPAVARFGGAVWVFILVMIVLMPVVIPRVKARGNKQCGL